jgi:hypothetical protein
MVMDTKVSQKDLFLSQGHQELLKECKKQKLDAMTVKFPPELVSMTREYMKCINCVDWVSQFHTEFPIMRQCTSCHQLSCLDCWAKERMITGKWMCPKCAFINVVKHFKH